MGEEYCDIKRIFNKGYSLVEKTTPVDPLNPVTAFYLTNRFADFQRELPAPQTGNKQEWEEWRTALRARLREVFCLDAYGDVPTPEIKVLAEEKCETYIRQKIAYESLPGNWVSAYLLIPDGISDPVPAVLCPHGHFRGGKDSVVFPKKAAGKAYAHEFAKNGFVALAPDNAGMAVPPDLGTNERDVPISFLKGHNEGGCNLLFRRLNHMGLDITGFRVFELMVALNILCSMKQVDNKRIGCAGLSGGCWLSQVLAALDTRVSAVILSGYFTTFVQTAWLGHCVCHHPFGIGKICDMPDISALIAPRFQFVESGMKDIYYPVEPAYSMVKKAYELLGAEENIDMDLYDGGHEFHGTNSIPWMISMLTK